jgi:CheY-like chemotaxis protein
MGMNCDILIIDDDFEDVELLMEVLNKGGMSNLHYVHSATDALRYLEEAYPDCIPKVIITDIFLPGMSGLEFLSNLKNVEKFKSIKVVLLSSATSQSHYSLFKDLGHTDFFQKPNSLKDYSHIVESIKKKFADN